MAVSKGKDGILGGSGDGAAAVSLGASLGLSDADLLAMYRMIALARPLSIGRN